MALLEADSIGKAYGHRRVLTAASLRAYPGTTMALCGRNGSGKSTLLAIAAGWRRADTGVVRFDGTTWFRPRLPMLARRGVFYLPDRAILAPGIPLGAQLEAMSRRFAGLRITNEPVPEPDNVPPRPLPGERLWDVTPR